MQRGRRLSRSHARIRIDHSLGELGADAALGLLIRRGSRSGCILWLASVKSLIGGKYKQVQNEALLVEGIKGILGDIKVSSYSSSFFSYLIVCKKTEWLSWGAQVHSEYRCSK